jgi:predicted nucleotidyltransferase
VKTLAVFGSVARDEARPDSDVDILVECRDSATFNGYMDLKLFLEDLLCRPVDLVSGHPQVHPAQAQDTDREEGPIF